MSLQTTIVTEFNKTQPISQKAILNSQILGFYRLSYYLAVQQAGLTGSISLGINFENYEGDEIVLSGSPCPVVSNGRDSGQFIIWIDAITPISYSVIFNGVTGQMIYDLEMVLEKLSNQ